MLIIQLQPHWQKVRREAAVGVLVGSRTSRPAAACLKYSEWACQIVGSWRGHHVNWQLPEGDITISDALREAVGGHPLVAELLARRGFAEPDAALAFLDPARYRPAPPDDLPGLCAAAERLLEAVQRGERILVWGDFDVDGQTATALLVGALQGLGAEVRFHVPLREHGHGVQPDRLAVYLAEGIDLLLTCDTGIAAYEAVDAARTAGVDVLITDHHTLPSGDLPAAFAVVNPQLLDAGHPLRDLPGVGVAYKLVEKLYELAGRPDDAAQFLDLVALGIVADVAVQRHDTRYLLQRGIDKLRYPARVGLAALLEAAKVDPARLSAETIGYQLGPRLNALGRLGDASLAVELLTTRDRATARQIAAQLEVLNDQRRQIQDDVTAAALAQVEKNPELLDAPVLVVGGENWHRGIIGPVASRLAEQFRRPAVVLALPRGGDGRAFGSARSWAGVNIAAAFAACAGLLDTHGGHTGAAGCSLDPERIPQFRRQLANAVAAQRGAAEPDAPRIDAVVKLGDVTEPLAAELDRLAPFGEGNPPVQLMAPSMVVKTSTVFGIGRQHRRVTLEDAAGQRFVMTWWRGAEHTLPQGIIDVLYTPRVADYRGQRSLQLEWVTSRPTPGAAVEVGLRPEVIDLRADLDPLGKLPADGYRVWAEGLSPGDLPFSREQIISRFEAAPASALVIWTAPPGPAELQAMIEQSQARAFYVVGQQVPDGSAEGFLQRLAGLAKHAAAHYAEGVPIQKLAAATGQREVVVRAGLDWLAAKGLFAVDWPDGDTVVLTPGGTPDPGAVDRLLASLRAMLAETAAFRAYFRRADLAAFFEG